MIDHQKNLMVLENMDYIKKFYDVDANKKSYPQLCGSVQDMPAVVNHYWGVGQLQLAGVVGV